MINNEKTKASSLLLNMAIDLIDMARESLIDKETGVALMNLEKAMDLLKSRRYLWPERE